MANANLEEIGDSGKPNTQEKTVETNPTFTIDTVSKHVDDHCHVTNNDKNRNKAALYKLLTALGLCVVFMIGEIIGGLIAGSISIQTDAAHMAADITGFLFSILAIFFSKKGNLLK